MEKNYLDRISHAVCSFWNTRASQGSVLAGKQLDAFIDLLKKVAVDTGVPAECIYTRNNHLPGYYRATKDWDLIVISPKNDLVAAVELKSQVGSYGNNFNNRAEESLGSSEDFWTAFRENSFSSIQSPWLGYVMVVGKEPESMSVVKVSEPHFPVRPEFKNATYIDRYSILFHRLVLEHKYNAVALIVTAGTDRYESPNASISIETFINSFRGHLLGLADEFK